MKRKELVLNTLVVVTTAAAAIGMIAALMKIYNVLVLVLVSILVASGLSPLVRRVQAFTFAGGRRLSRPLAILVVFVALAALLAVASVFLFLPLKQEAVRFRQEFPGYVERLERWVEELRASYPRLPSLAEMVDRIPKDFDFLAENLGQAAAFSIRFVGGLFSLLLVVIMSVYMLAESEQLLASFLQAFDDEVVRERARLVFQKISGKLSAWVVGRVVQSLAISALTLVGLWALGVPYAFLLAVLAGVLDVIPFLGPLIAAVPAVIVALTLGLGKAAAVALLYLVIQQVQGAVIAPKVTQMSVGISPLLTIIAVLVGQQLMGLIGVLLAVPIAAALQVVAGEALASLREAGPAQTSESG